MMDIFFYFGNSFASFIQRYRFFIDDISDEEHYKRAEIPTREYRNQINKDLLISNVSY